MPDDIIDELEEARAKIEAAREVMLAILERGINAPEFRQAVARLERIEAELRRIESRIADRATGTNGA